jgi:hypothetical protein
MKRLFSIVLLLGLVQGCGKGPAENADVERAGPALRMALEAWKSGKSQQELADQDPSIIVNEDDWRVGKRLLHFEMEEKGSLSGRQVVWKVRIELEDKDGKKEDRKATYVIDTTPRLVIVRDLFASRGR